MARRPVFLPQEKAPWVRACPVEFEWFAGFSRAQKLKSVKALHQAACSALSLKAFLEVSTKSQEPLGVRLSAFNLQLTSSEAGRPIIVEAAFQGSKIFESSGRHPELYELSDGREIKRRMREYTGDHIVAFEFDGNRWPINPPTLFYDWLYLSAILELRAREDGLVHQLSLYDGFTDIEFNPLKSLNCQAHSCALGVSLSRAGKMSVVEDRDSFIEFVRDSDGAIRTRPERLF